MSVTPNLCCDETRNQGTYTRVTVLSSALRTMPFIHTLSTQSLLNKERREKFIAFCNFPISRVSRSAVSNSATPRTVAGQAPLPRGCSRKEYQSGLPFASPGALPNPGIKPWSPALLADSHHILFHNISLCLSFTSIPQEPGTWNRCVTNKQIKKGILHSFTVT